MPRNPGVMFTLCEHARLIIVITIDPLHCCSSRHRHQMREIFNRVGQDRQIVLTVNSYKCFANHIG